MLRSIKQQLNRALSEHSRSGHSKRADRKAGVNTELYSYSQSQYKDLKAFNSQFGAWMATAHPDVKRVKDIKTEHLQGFLAAHLSTWNAQTYNKMLSLAAKSSRMAANTFHISSDSWDKGIVRMDKSQFEKDRTVCVTAKELAAIRSDAKTATGEGIKAAVFGSYFGLRSGSIPYIQVEDLHTDHIHIRQDKGGRPRDIPIRTREQKAAVQAALRHAETHQRSGSDTVFGCKSAAITKAVSRSCSKHGLQTIKDSRSGQHAMRKSYARMRYEEEYAKLHGRSPYRDASGNDRHALDDRDPAERVEYDRTAWNIVDDELGHGRDRMDLFQAYIVQTQG